MRCFIRENNLFTIMPQVAILSSKNGIQKFKEKKDILYQNEDEKEFKDILELIYTKLTTDDQPWTINEYRKFKLALNNISNNEFRIIANSIKKCLEAEELEIYKHICSFVNKTDWYPKKERIKDSNNKYIYKCCEMKPTDCFYIINNLMVYMHQFIYKYAEKLVEQSNFNEEFKESIMDIKDNFMEELDNNFKYIKKYPLFEDVYFNFKQDSLTILLRDIYLIKGRNNQKQIQNTSYGANIYAQTHRAPLRNYSKTLTKIKNNQIRDYNE